MSCWLQKCKATAEYELRRLSEQYKEVNNPPEEFSSDFLPWKILVSIKLY
jgi:hypothetical protein